jgi:hypothetical protein
MGKLLEKHGVMLALDHVEDVLLYYVSNPV